MAAISQHSNRVRQGLVEEVAFHIIGYVIGLCVAGDVSGSRQNGMFPGCGLPATLKTHPRKLNLGTDQCGLAPSDAVIVTPLHFGDGAHRRVSVAVQSMASSGQG